MTDRPPLAVDDRQDDAFTAALRQEFTVTEKRLPVGDLVWSCPLGSVGIEDKCMEDLVDSRRNGRLDSELRRLTAAYAVPILLTRGTTVGGTRWRSGWEPSAIENLLFGRQLHGAYVYRVPQDFGAAALSVRALHDYLGRLAPMEGVTRVARLRYTGPLSNRAEVIFGILGMCPGIRGRRAVADRIAATTSVGGFLRWGTSDFLAAGFTPLMARKLTAAIANMEAPHGSTR